MFDESKEVKYLSKEITNFKNFIRVIHKVRSREEGGGSNQKLTSIVLVTSFFFLKFIQGGGWSNIWLI